MNIVMFGDSITDMCRNREIDFDPNSYGEGYVFHIEGELSTRAPKKYAVYNRGIGGNRVVDLYARIKSDVWNLNPDVLSILIGVNDVWGDIRWKMGVEAERFEKVYRMMIEETKERCPNVKLMLLEPFFLNGRETDPIYEQFLQVKEHAKIVKRLAQEYGCVFVPLQDQFDSLAQKYGAAYWLYDGVHPTVAGAKVIANAWLKAFDEINTV